MKGKEIRGMKKIRVIKDMPFAKVGTVWKLHGEVVIIDTTTEHEAYYDATEMVQLGYFEWVEEPKTLAQKLEEGDEFGKNYKDLAMIAKEYFQQHPEEIGCVAKEKVLEVFGKVYDYELGKDGEYVVSKIRKALKQL